MDTIVAVATPPGRSAIGLIRLSGPQSVEILCALLGDKEFQPEANRIVLKQILNAESDDVLDSALISFFKAPHSFTGEDMVEINCHGSPVILRQLLDQILKLDARLAGPGEFSLRACRNGKMNLSQAEGIRDLINARTAAAAQQATRQLKGELSTALQECKDDLVTAIVRLESALEFVEDDLPQIQVNETAEQLSGIANRLAAMAASYETGHLLRDGLRVALVGRPNVGKSSLFNRLVRFDRAIVTDLPGTTRDSLRESISIQGIPVTLTDTAGMRNAADQIEALGIRRTEQAIADADLVVAVVDGSSELTDEDEIVLREAKAARHIVAVNKSDLSANQRRSQDWNGDDVVHVSALTGAGLDDLAMAIVKPFASVEPNSVGLMITDSRHYDLLTRAVSSVEQSRALMDQRASEEIVLVGLHNALRFLGEITGETTTDDILGQIFSTFCIGK